MKKMKKYQEWFCIAGGFVICGCIHLFFSWIQYNNILTAVPFSLTVLLHVLGYGGAALICLSVGWILRKKSKNRKDDTQ